MIWRIEKFQVVPWPKENYGKFFSGDSYIVLRTYYKKPDDKKFSYDIHFWLGQDSSQDEMGTAAYKTVELDDYLGTTPVQFREVQGYESDSFLALFPKFQTMKGGVDSGFKVVKPEEYKPRLLQVKGAKNRIVVREVPKHVDSLNIGDVFLLDCGLELFQFNGSQSNPLERTKCGELLRAIETERKGKAKTLVLTETDTADLKTFFAALGSEGKIKSAQDGGSDHAVQTEKKLFRLSDASGQIQFKEEATGKIYYKMLDTNDVFVLDIGSSVFVWMGKNATAQEKKLGIQYAVDYLKKYNRPLHTPVSRVLEGGENQVFHDALDGQESGKPNFTIKKANATVQAKDPNQAPPPQLKNLW